MKQLNDVKFKYIVHKKRNIKPILVYADIEGNQISTKIKIGKQYYSGYLGKSFRNLR